MHRVPLLLNVRVAAHNIKFKARKTRFGRIAGGGGGSDHDDLGNYYVRTFEREVPKNPHQSPNHPGAHVRPMGSSNFA